MKYHCHNKGLPGAKTKTPVEDRLQLPLANRNESGQGTRDLEGEDTYLEDLDGCCAAGLSGRHGANSEERSFQLTFVLQDMQP